MAFMDQFYSDFFLNKKEPPLDAIPGTFCHFPTYITSPKLFTIIGYMQSHSLLESYLLWEKLYPSKQSMLIDGWNEIILGKPQLIK